MKIKNKKQRWGLKYAGERMMRDERECVGSFWRKGKEM